MKGLNHSILKTFAGKVFICLRPIRKKRRGKRTKMNWLLIGVAALVILLVFTKFGEMKHKYLLRIGIILIIILACTAGYVYINSAVDLTTYNGMITFGKTYFSWVGGAFRNLGGVTGYATTQNWGLNATALAPSG